MKELIIIAAAGTNNALGKDNKLLWHLPDDFKHFKKTTVGHPMIMGRKTFESLPGVLAGRHHIVVSKNPTYKLEDDSCILATSLEEAIDLAQAEKIFIIGGGQLYKQSMEVATKIILTRVNGNFEADTFFPEIDESTWEKTHSEQHSKDDKHPYSFSIDTYERR